MSKCNETHHIESEAASEQSKDYLSRISIEARATWQTLSRCQYRFSNITTIWHFLSVAAMEEKHA